MNFHSATGKATAPARELPEGLFATVVGTIVRPYRGRRPTVSQFG